LRGSDIKKYLEENGIKQNFLSEKTGIPASVINAILNDKRKVEANEYMKICDAIGVPLDYFRPKASGKEE
jgi:transcriptional regulator with XRE-family HTH domain